MIIKKLQINSIDKVKEFCNAAVFGCEADVDVVSDRYVIDGKSIMGLFSLDLSKVLELRVHADSLDEFKTGEFLESIKHLLVE